MPTRRSIIGLAVIAALAAAGTARAQERIPVVATFSILGDLVKNVGGERVEVVTLVGPNSDVHVYSPTPSDVKAVARAKAVFVNGLGLEGWLTRLATASGTKAPTVVASQGIKPLRMEDEGHPGKEITDPHAWQSIANARIYVANIAAGLGQADPAGRSQYEANAKAYVARLDKLEQEVKAAIATIPPARRKIITTHDAFGYFAAAYGMEFIAPEGVSTDTEPSAKDVGKIIAQIRKEHVPAIFMENISDPRMMQAIARESGARIGGTLYSDALSPPNGPAATYIDMMHNNIRELADALKG